MGMEGRLGVSFIHNGSFTYVRCVGLRYTDLFSGCSVLVQQARSINTSQGSNGVVQVASSTS